MSPQQEAVALWKYLEGRGLKPSMNSVAETLRRHKVKFRDSDLRRWLDDFAPQSRRKQAANGPQKSSTLAACWTQTGRTPAAASREKEVPLFSSLVEPSGSTSIADAPKAVRAVRVQRLPFDRELYDRKNALLAALWAVVQPVIGRAVTATEWKKQNARYALDMARNEIPPPMAVKAWEIASRRIGEPVRSLRIVQDQITMAYATRAAENGLVAQC